MTLESPEYAALQALFPEECVAVNSFREQVYVTVRKDRIVEVLRFLKEDERFLYDYLADVTAVDYLRVPRRERFEVVYQLYSHKYNRRFRIKALVPEQDPTVDSVVPLYRTANWLEREVYDMFGITFKGHPNLVRILMPDYYHGHPLRKDYPLKGQGERESFKVVK